MTKATSSQLEQHPLALQMVPGSMSDEEFEALCADMLKRGQRVPIVMYENKVLDGWHRYRANMRNNTTPKFETYDGDDAAGLVITLNVLRRKLGSTQRARAGAELNINYSITQDEASKRVGVSKVHINLVVQALKSKNARVIKLLEKPDLTREQLHDELVECGVISTPNALSSARSGAQSNLPGTAAGRGLEAFFAAPPGQHNPDDDDDLLGGTGETEGIDLDDVLGEPPSANGTVISFKKPTETSPGGLPVVGARPKHGERVSRDTPASLLAEKFRGLTEAEQVSFMQLTWHVQRKLLKVAGLSVEADTPPGAKPGASAPAPVGKASKATSGEQAKAALQASAAIEAAKQPAKAAKQPAKAAKTAKGAHSTAKAERAPF